MTGDFEHFSQGGQGSETPRKSKTFISTYMEDFPMANYITPERERERDGNSKYRFGTGGT